MLTKSIVISFLLMFVAGSGYAQKGWVIEDNSGDETLVVDYLVKENTVQFFTRSGNTGFMAKSLINRIVLLEDIETYQPPKKDEPQGSISDPWTVDETFHKVSATLAKGLFTTDSPTQAALLLKLIEQYPQKSDYRITVENNGIISIFGYETSSATLKRLNQYPSGSGNVETWKYYVMDRLKNATAGGSLNDTPEGKLPGTYRNFKK